MNCAKTASREARGGQKLEGIWENRAQEGPAQSCPLKAARDLARDVRRRNRMRRWKRDGLSGADVGGLSVFNILQRLVIRPVFSARRR